ncbi:MAG: DsrE/DsrF/DrsH-like family protein [Candidatus Firestonebacteria bacterium]
MTEENSPVQMKDKMTIILFSGELDKAIAAFTLATTAAASNMEVSIFFTFWGLNTLKKTTFVPAKPQMIMQKMLNFMNRGLPLSRLNMFGLGPWMMKKLMKKTKMASLEDLMKLAKQLNVKYIACTTSCSVMGLSKESLISDVNEFAGASTYLAEAKDAKVNLFI